jgi:hypothetical protein
VPTTDDYGQGVNIAALTDAPDASKLAKDIANALAPRGVMRFASASERGATLVGSQAPAEGMATWLRDVKRLEVYDGSAWVVPPQPVTTTTSGATAASGFTMINWEGWKAGPVTTINFACARTGSNIFSDKVGSIPDTTIGTLPAGWRPPDTIYACVGDGFGNGECAITAAGVISIRSWSTNASGSTTTGGIITGRNLRVTSTFIQP